MRENQESRAFLVDRDFGSGSLRAGLPSVMQPFESFPKAAMATAGRCAIALAVLASPCFGQLTDAQWRELAQLCPSGVPESQGSGVVAPHHGSGPAWQIDPNSYRGLVEQVISPGSPLPASTYAPHSPGTMGSALTEEEIRQWNPHAKATAQNRLRQQSGLPVITVPSTPTMDESLPEPGVHFPGQLVTVRTYAEESDPLGAMGPSVGGLKNKASDTQTNAGNAGDPDPHASLYAESLYPAAAQCAKCHEQVYDEWRVSNHAYASISPMFHKFEQAVSSATAGTSGYFCMRCHAPVATQLSFPREASILEGPKVVREGVTCIACHRVNEYYGKVNGARRIEPGSIYDPIYGSIGGDGVARVAEKAADYKVKLTPDDKNPGQPMHTQGKFFQQISDSTFCASCHMVTVQPGIALEVVWAQYRASPAYRRGVSCQDCHMGLVPGKDSGYATAPAAIVDGKAIEPYRKHSNHYFYGPGYPIAHPGIFPHNEKSYQWKASDWFQFDWREGWGTDAFEDAVARLPIPPSFPAPWKNAQDRRDARKIIDENLKLTDAKRETAYQVLENAINISGPFFHNSPTRGTDLSFKYDVKNISDGHNMPSGSLGAQPQLWLNVVLVGPDGRRLWESGYTDGNGDLADLHSLQVRAGLIPRDPFLFNLQTKFLITNLKGTDRELYIPVNVDIDQIPFFRPGNVPYTVLNHAPFARMEAHSLPPLGTKTAKYKVPGNLLTAAGRYRLSARMRSRPEPIYFMRFCRATAEMERMMNERIIDVAAYSVEFEVR